MAARAWIALVAVLVPAARAQSSGDVPTPAALDAAAWIEHDACVRSERQQRFLSHYVSATPEARAKAAAALEAARPVGASPNWAPGLEALRRVETELSTGAQVERVESGLEALPGETALGDRIPPSALPRC